MLLAYRESAGRILPWDGPPEQALWIDLLRPTAEEAAVVGAMGIEVPTLEDMQEIEVSNRLYREGGLDYLTVVLQGHSESRSPVSGPVTFILSEDRLVTVRHHDCRPFETFPTRADKGMAGCSTANRLWLSLVEEIVGRLADLLESVGKTLDGVTRGIYEPGRKAGRAEVLETSLREIGREGELLGIIRLALLTTERALGFYTQTAGERRGDDGLGSLVATLQRDIDSLEEHVDFLSSRVGLATDATMGMINLEQNATVRIVSVISVLFVPPTLIASVYGMNFRVMPELDWGLGYPAALGLMLASAAIAFAWFRWKNWL